MKKAPLTPAQALRAAAFELAALGELPPSDSRDSKFQKQDEKLQKAAVAFAEWEVKREAFDALLELGAVNAHEADRVMRGKRAREVPPGLPEAIRKAKRAEERRDELLGVAQPRGRFHISKMTWFQKEILGGVVRYGHKAEDRREERILNRFLELGVIEPCSGPTSAARERMR
jgi:hypothetical protein